MATQSRSLKARLGQRGHRCSDSRAQSFGFARGAHRNGARKLHSPREPDLVCAVGPSAARSPEARRQRGRPQWRSYFISPSFYRTVYLSGRNGCATAVNTPAGPALHISLCGNNGQAPISAPAPVAPIRSFICCRGRTEAKLNWLVMKTAAPTISRRIERARHFKLCASRAASSRHRHRHRHRLRHWLAKQRPGEPWLGEQWLGGRRMVIRK